MDKAEKKAKSRAWRERERVAAHAQLPLGDVEMEALFDALDERLEEAGCDDTRRLTQTWLQKHGLATEAVNRWLMTTAASATAKSWPTAKRRGAKRRARVEPEPPDEDRAVLQQLTARLDVTRAPSSVDAPTLESDGPADSIEGAARIGLHGPGIIVITRMCIAWSRRWEEMKKERQSIPIGKGFYFRCVRYRGCFVGNPRRH